MAELPFADLLGRVLTLPVRRMGPPGAFLAVDPADPSPNAKALLLPGTEMPKNTKEGDEIEVFVYLDSEDRPITTVHPPKVALGQVAFLEVTDRTAFGAFVDWGLQKELLVPLAEQTRELLVGERHPIGLYVDDSGRLAGTMRVSEMLKDKGEFSLDEWVVGEAWRSEEGIGVFVIVERSFVGLVPEAEPNALARGESARFRVTNILPDGKIELSLRGPAHEELANDAKKILEILALPATPKVGDRSSPEEIRAIFGLSKKAFKRAVGRLLKERSVDVDAGGFLVRSRR